MQSSKVSLIVFLIISTFVILLLVGLIISLIYIYQKKQLVHQENIDGLKIDHEKTLMASQLEIQESTFQHISREIHDNINLSLTLAKLKLNSLGFSQTVINVGDVRSSVDLIGVAIDKLSAISKSLNSDIISSMGLIAAVEKEVEQIKETGLIEILLCITGSTMYMDSRKELVILRIIQEALNNIVKHSSASQAHISLNYCAGHLDVTIRDNGRGFVPPDPNENTRAGKAGLSNMSKRVKAMTGEMTIESSPGQGTTLNFIIPF